MNNHWWQQYQTVDKGICTPKFADLCKEEYELTLKWVKANPEEAANFILNIIVEQMENQIDFESHYLPIWFKIKGIKKEHPIQKLDTDTAPVILANVNKPEDYDELVKEDKHE